MRPATLAGLLIVCVVGAALLGLTVLAPDQPAAGTDRPGLTERWVSSTTRDIEANHHAPVAGRVAGHAIVIAPISGVAHEHGHDTATEHEHTAHGRGCALVALHGANGTTRWADRVPPTNCTIHSVADPALADIDGDDTEEVLAATTERALKGFEPLTGQVIFRYDLSAYGYTEPLVANVTGDPAPELVIVDVKGSVFVLDPNGTTVWRDLHDSYTWGQPHVAAFSATGDPGLFVALGTGTMLMYDAHDGSVRWRRTLNGSGAITWTTTGQADEDPGVEIAVATDSGGIRLYDGRRDGSNGADPSPSSRLSTPSGTATTTGPPRCTPSHAMASSGAWRPRPVTSSGQRTSRPVPPR